MSSTDARVSAQICSMSAGSARRCGGRGAIPPFWLGRARAREEAEQDAAEQEVHGRHDAGRTVVAEAAVQLVVFAYENGLDGGNGERGTVGWDTLYVLGLAEIDAMSDMNIDLTGKRAFVSGSTQGIGRVIAARLAAAGAITYINGRDLDRVDAVVAELRAELPEARIDGVAADLGTPYGARELFDALPTSTSSSTTSASSSRGRCSRSTTRPGSASGRSTSSPRSASRATSCRACATAAGAACSSWPATRPW
jgi:hypothetical protein